jgi:hypothetical protein
VRSVWLARHTLTQKRDKADGFTGPRQRRRAPATWKIYLVASKNIWVQTHTCSIPALRVGAGAAEAAAVAAPVAAAAGAAVSDTISYYQLRVGAGAAEAAAVAAPVAAAAGAAMSDTIIDYQFYYQPLLATISSYQLLSAPISSYQLLSVTISSTISHYYHY